MGLEFTEIEIAALGLSVPEGERTALLTYLNGQQEFGSIAAADKNRPLHHGGTRHGGRTKNKWVVFGPLIPGCIKNQDLDISNFSLQQKFEDTGRFCLSRHSAQ